MKSTFSSTLPSAKPYAFKFDIRRTALVIIDVQKDFVDPNGFGSIQCGSSEIFAGVRAVVGRIKAVLDASRSLGLHIVHTREGHEPDLSDLPASKKDRQVNNPTGHHVLGIGEEGPVGRLLVRGQQGHDIVEELEPLPGEVIVDKSGKGSFWATDLHRRLMARGITHLLFTGVTTECCVTTTVREANDRGFECCILSDCTSGFNPEFVRTSLDMISAYDGLFGYVAPSHDLLALDYSSSRLTPPLTPPSEESQQEGGLGISNLQRQYRNGSIDPISLVKQIYDKIERDSDRFPYVWIHLRPQSDVLDEAATLANKYNAKSLPPLYGVPYAIKDNFDVAGLLTTAACPGYGYIAMETALSIAALIEAGALLIGKTNMDQLATGLSGCRSPYGTPCSIYGQKKYISGGSSSGSGIAVAAQLVTFALGTDTAGSGRVPAALNGIVGFKPTKGTISARGVVPACKSLDTVSVFAASVEDARRVWQVMDFFDEQDPHAKIPSSLPLRAVDYRGVRQAGFTFAIPPTSALDVCETTYQDLFSKTLLDLENMGGRISPISQGDWKLFQDASDLLYSGTLVNERIACIGHDFIVNNLDKLHPTTSKLFGSILDRASRPWDLFSDQIKQAECTRKVQKIFERFDVIVLPAVPCHPTIEAMDTDPIGLNAKMGEFTHFANVLDLCAINLNAAFYEGKNGKMPFGISLIGGMGMDGKLMDIASHIEQKLQV